MLWCSNFHGTGNKRYLCTSSCSCLRQSHTLFARRPITYKSDWIKSLTGSTGTHDNMFVSQQATVVGLVNNVLGLLPNIFRVGQSTFTGVNTRQPTHGWFDDMDSAGSKCHHIGLRCRV